MIRALLILPVLAAASCVAVTPAPTPQPQGNDPIITRPTAGDPLCTETVDTRTGEILDIVCF